MKFKNLLISIAIIVLILSGLNTGSAETGTVTVSTNTIPTYLGNFVPGGAGAPSTVPNMTYFEIDFTDYNSITNMSYSPAGGFSYPHLSNVTSFTCVSGCSGGGIVSYSQFLDTINWNWNPSSTITASEFVLSYDDAIFTGLATTGAVAVNTRNGPPDITHPYCIQTPNSLCMATPSTYSGLYGIDVSTSATVNYGVSYPIPGFYQFFTIKSGTVATRVIYHSQSNDTSTLMLEPSFTTSNFNGSAAYTDGLYINLTLAGGQYNDVLINATGATGIATATPTPVVDPVTGKGIIFDANEYTIGQTANISWVISDSIWNLFTTNTISIRKIDDLDPNHFTSLISTAPQNGTIQYTFYNCDGGFVCGTGGYEVVLYRNLLGIFETSRETASTNVFEATAYVNSPLVVNEGQTVNVGWKFGVATNEGYLIDDKLDEFGVSTFTPVYNNLNCPCTVASNSTSITFVGAGKHRLSLFDASTIQNVASVIVTVLPADTVIGQNITQNYFVIDKSTYDFSDTIYGQYQISTTNWTTYPYIAVSFASAAGIPMNPGMDVLTTQTGSFEIPIEATQLNFIQGGSAFVNLTFKSSVFNSTSITAESIPITINLNKGGWSVAVNKKEVCNGQPVKVTYTSPTGAGILEVSYFAKGAQNKVLTYPFNTNGSKNIVIPDANINAGVAIDIQDSTGVYQIGTIIKIVNTGCVATTTTTPKGSAASTTDDILSNGMYVALMMLIAFAVMGHMIGGLEGSIIGFGAGFIFTAVYGLMPLWALFLFAIVVIVVLAIMFGSAISGGGGQ